MRGRTHFFGFFLMFYFLFFLSSCETFNAVGYEYRSVSEGTQFDFILQDSERNNSVFLIWGGTNQIKSQIKLTNDTDYVFTYSPSDTAGIKLSGKTANVSFSSAGKIAMWLMPSNLCTGPSILYSTKKYLQEDLTLKNGLKENQDLCVFFSAQGQAIDIYAKAEHKKAAVQPNVEIYGFDTNQKTVTSLGKCHNSSCTALVRQPVFLRLTKLIEGSSYSIDVTYTQEDDVPKDMCSRSFLTQFDNGNEIEQSVVPSLHELVCEAKTPYSQNAEHFYISLAIVVISIAVAIVCYITGTCNKISRLCDNTSVTIEGPGQELIDDQPDNLVIDDEGQVDP